MKENGEDYTFSFRLDPEPSLDQGMDPLIETIRSFLDDFLKFGVLTYKGERVSVDGFKLLNDKETVHDIFVEE